jgi:hypothetical protein
VAKRPCSICRRWFERDPRAGKRHAVCDAESCQRERNRRACARWRAENPEKVVAARLRRRLLATPPAPEEVVRVQPMRYFDPEVVRHLAGAEMQVVLEETAKVILAAARHVVVASRQVVYEGHRRFGQRTPLSW